MEKDVNIAAISQAEQDIKERKEGKLVEKTKFLATAKETLKNTDDIGEVSDGYHTYNELYHHRAVLFSMICNRYPSLCWKSKRHHDGTMYDGMFIVGINTPNGQASYHYDIDKFWSMFRVPTLGYAPEWDGHTPEEAIRRISLMTF